MRHGVTVRLVAPRGEWWLSDGGDLLARFQENKQPLAVSQHAAAAS